MNILLSGGAGFIGSHTAVELLNTGYKVVIVDDFSNSSADVLNNIKKITGKSLSVYNNQIQDKSALIKIFAVEHIDSVIHFAGFKAVAESIHKPLEYYRNNIDTTLTLLECMQEYSVNSIVFSSSATVYGTDNEMPCLEDMPRGDCTNPYGWTKVMNEQILQDASVANSDLSVVLLRYFNPIGAHTSGLIGERPQGIPNNLMPYVTQVASKKLDHLTIFGNDYDTPDGTCMRDYIHVMDLANAHVKAIEYASKHKGTEIFNIGTGKPYSVLELVQTFEKANNLKLKYEFGKRREGDLASCYANVVKATKILGWHAERDLYEMCRDSWRWEKNFIEEDK